MLSRLVREKRIGTENMQSLNSVVISMDLVNQKYWGPYVIGKHNALRQYDVSNHVHNYGYVRTVLGAGKPGGPDIDAVWGCEQNTTFIPGMNWEGWALVNLLLGQIRIDRIEHAMKKPRVMRGQNKGVDDFLDAALMKSLSRVNAILNEVLYWGNIEEVSPFSRDTQVYM